MEPFEFSENPIFIRKRPKKIFPEDYHTQEEIDAAYEEMRLEAEVDEMEENEINELRSECDWMDE